MANREIKSAFTAKRTVKLGKRQKTDKRKVLFETKMGPQARFCRNKGR